MTARIESAPEGQQKNTPRVLDYSLDRDIRFLFDSPEAAKEGAIKAMEKICLTERMREQINSMDLRGGSADIHWDYVEGTIPVKTTVRISFDTRENAWITMVDQVRSANPLRPELEETLDQHSIAGRAWIKIGFSDEESAGAYQRSLGISRTPDAIEDLALGEVFKNVLYRLQGGYEDNPKESKDRAQRIKDMVLAFTAASGRDTQRLIQEEAHHTLQSSVPGTKAYPNRHAEADVIAEIKIIFEILSDSLKRDTPSARQFYGIQINEVVEIIQNLWPLLDRADQRRLLHDAIATTKEISGHISSSIACSHIIDSQTPHHLQQPDCSVHISSDGTNAVFDTKTERFSHISQPRTFDIYVQPKAPSADPELQDRINIVASSVAQQEPTFLSKKLGRSPADEIVSASVTQIYAALSSTEDPDVSRFAHSLIGPYAH